MAVEPSIVAASPGHANHRTGLSTSVALLLVVALGVNIRAVFGATPPLIPLISDDLGMSATTASLLTSLSVLAMAAGAPLGHAIASRVGVDGGMISLLFALSFAELSRLVTVTAVPLVLSAGLIGIFLGAVSTLAPAFISHHLPRLRGLGTGVYSTSMALGVGLAAGTAQPISDRVGWRPTLALWGVAALALTAVLLVVALRGLGVAAASGPRTRLSLPLRERRAWFVTLVYGVPMFLGFGVIAWLPSLFIEHGIDPSTAAAYLVCFQAVQLFSILTLAPLTDRITGRRGVFATAMITSTAGTLMLALHPHDWALPGALLAGFGIGGASTLALVKVQDEATSPHDATRLSSMCMLFSFTAGGAAPFLMGALKDLTGSLVPGFGMCFAVSALSLLLLIRMHPADARAGAAPDPG